MIPFSYSRATSVDSATRLAASDRGAVFIAGGTNLVDLMKKGVNNPSRVIDITRLPLKQVEWKGNRLVLGALALNAEVSEHPLVTRHFPLLSQALKAGASPQLRNMATVGGNIMQRTRCPYFYDTALPCNKRNPGSGCGALEGYNRMHAIFGWSPHCIAVHPSDMCVALAALDATVKLRSPRGERSIAFADFHRLPGDRPEADNTLERNELITSIEIPAANRFAAHSYYLKVRDRASYAFALVSVAAAVELDGNRIRDVRLAMGGVAHKPWRLKQAEDFLKQKTVSTSVFEEAAALALRDARPHRHNAFKPKLAVQSISEALTRAVNPTA